jgi:hypothetical protein
MSELRAWAVECAIRISSGTDDIGDIVSIAHVLEQYVERGMLATPSDPAAPPEMISGEPLRLTADEWARVPTIEPAAGPCVAGYAVCEAQHDRVPGAPIMTHDEYLRSVA